MTPLAKTGGLGDVLGALPQALAESGHDVRVCIPGYAFIKTNGISKTNLSGEINIGGLAKQYSVSEYISSNKKSITYLINNAKLFDRASLYVDPDSGTDYPDNDIRFAFLCKAALDLTQKLFWQPDIVYAHDWQGALAAVYLKTNESKNAFFANTKAVLTIHNIAYQGKFKKERFALLGLPDKLINSMGPMEFYDETSFLKGGISFADKITTVSETYAKEIQGAQGFGLEEILLTRTKDVSGIVNGVDYSIWAPSTDKLIPHRYLLSNLSGKKMNKIELLNQCGLPVRTETPLIGMVSRLVEQKGLQLIINAASQLFSKDIQMIILGTGDKKIEQQLKVLESNFSDKLKVFLKFDEKLAHTIEAGADFFLMPSIFEPCGLNQMYSLKYGTPPVVHSVGGLADTVVDYDSQTEQGTGFVFKDFTETAMMKAIQRAIELFPKKRKWTKLMKNGMRQDFSWNNSAQKYLELFSTLIKS